MLTIVSYATIIVESVFILSFKNIMYIIIKTQTRRRWVVNYIHYKLRVRYDDFKA